MLQTLFTLTKDEPGTINTYTLRARFYDDSHDKMFMIRSQRLRNLINRASYSATCILCADDINDTDAINERIMEG